MGINREIKDCLAKINSIKVKDGNVRPLQDDRAAEHEARRGCQSAQRDHCEGNLRHPAAASQALQAEPHLSGLGKNDRCIDDPQY